RPAAGRGPLDDAHPSLLGADPHPGAARPPAARFQVHPDARYGGLAVTTIRAWTGDATAWDALVTSDPDGTFDHLAGWHSVVSEALGHECLWWEAVDDRGALEGVLPLVRVR